MNRDDESARELAEELAEHPEDPRFRDRRRGVRASRTVSREEADTDTAGVIGGAGFGRTQGRLPPDTPADDELADTVHGSEAPPPAEDEHQNP